MICLLYHFYNAIYMIDNIMTGSVFAAIFSMFSNSVASASPTRGRLEIVLIIIYNFK